MKLVLFELEFSSKGISTKRVLFRPKRTFENRSIPSGGSLMKPDSTRYLKQYVYETQFSRMVLNVPEKLLAEILNLLQVLSEHDILFNTLR